MNSSVKSPVAVYLRAFFGNSFENFFFKNFISNSLKHFSGNCFVIYFGKSFFGHSFVNFCRNSFRKFFDNSFRSFFGKFIWYFWGTSLDNSSSKGRHFKLKIEQIAFLCGSKSFLFLFTNCSPNFPVFQQLTGFCNFLYDITLFDSHSSMNLRWKFHNVDNWE